MVCFELYTVTTTHTSSFEQALKRHTASCSYTTAADFEDTLLEQLDQPAVGTQLPFENVSLGQLPITTAPNASELTHAKTGVTPASFGIADYGSIVVTSGEEGTEQVSLFPDKHIAVLRESDILPDMVSAINRLDEAFADDLTSAVIATGPSATADMGELVYGAHGPSIVHVLILTDQ